MFSRSFCYNSIAGKNTARHDDEPHYPKLDSAINSPALSNFEHTLSAPNILNLRKSKTIHPDGECYPCPNLGMGSISNVTLAIHPNLNLRVDNHTAQNWAMAITHHNYSILSG